MTRPAMYFRVLPVVVALLFSQDVQSQDNFEGFGVLPSTSTGPRDSDPLVQRIRKSGGQPGFIGDKIVRVGIYEPQGDDHSFPFLKELVDLQELDINNTNSAKWAQHIAELPKLMRLQSYRGSLTDQSCEHLAELKQLRSLTLDVNEITDVGIAKIASLPNLEQLSLRHMPVTNDGLISLARLPKLKVLSLLNLHITPEGVLALRDSTIEELRWWFDSGYPNNSLIPYISQLPNLKRLDLASRSIGDEDLKVVGQMTGLEELDLSEHRLTDAGMVHLSGLKNLQHLVLLIGFSDKYGIGDAGIQHLSELSELTTLNLFNTKITDAGLTHLTGLRKLNTLSLGNTLITPSGIESLEQLPSLEQLDISGTKMKDAEQLDFRNMPSLKRLIAYDFDEQIILLPAECYVITFD